MPGLMILNPRPKKAKKSAPARKKQRRKMTAKQLQFFGPRKKRKAASKVVIVSSNPKGQTVAKKKRHRRKAKSKTFMSNPRGRRFRRNPRVLGAGLVENTLMPAAIGAAGALGVDLLLGVIPLPAAFQSGPLLPVVKVGAAILVGMGVGALTNREAGEQAAAGGAIVALYGLSRGWLINYAPSVPLARYVPVAGMGNTPFRAAGNGQGVGRYVAMSGLARTPLPAGMMTRGGSAHNGMRGLGRGMGFINPARVAGKISRAQARHLSSN